MKTRQFKNCYHRTIRGNTGFTLLEVVVALAVILAVLVGPVALATRGLFNFSYIKDKLIALNLAQEGIEIVRAVRDNNAICQTNTPSYSWIANSNNTGKLTDASQTKKVDARHIDSVSCASNTIANPRMNVPGNCSTDPLRISTTNGYGYEAGDPASLFSRCVSVTAASANENNIPANDMIDVVSRVTWLEHGFTRSVELRERLYNWKYPLSN